MLTVAVILVSYNQEDYILEALDGLRFQDRKPDQIIIADDGSVDSTQSIIQEYVKYHKLDNEWTLSLSKTNRGINLNLQEAFNLTNTDVIIGMAGDDISLKNRIQDSLILFEKYDVDIINLSGFIINDKGENIGEIRNKNQFINNVKKALINSSPLVNPVGHAIKSSVFKRYGSLPLNVPNEDDQITFRALVGNGIFCSDILGFKYRIHPKSESAWLRNNSNYVIYFNRFIRDLEVRKNHLYLWIDLIKSSKLDNKKELMIIANVKLEYLNRMQNIHSYSVFNRIEFAIKNSNCLKFKEVFYLIFFKYGIIAWYLCRGFIGRFKFN